MAAVQRGSAQDWIELNTEVVRCRAMNAADAFFSMWALLESATQADLPASIISATSAVNAVERMYGCSGPSLNEYQEYFSQGTYKCQCAQVGGTLFIKYQEMDGTVSERAMSEVDLAKEIVSTSLEDGTAGCTYMRTDGVLASAVTPVGSATSASWWITPIAGTACCDETPPKPPIPDQPEPYIFGDFAGKCGRKVILLDAAIDKWGFAWNFYYYEEDFRDCDGPRYQYYYWETLKGPFIYSLAADHEGFSSSPRYAPPHPHAPKLGGGGGACGISSLNKVSYFLEAGCTWNEEEQKYDTTYEYKIEDNPDGILGLARRMDALAWMINNSGLIPYTVCNVKPELEGSWVTTRWESTEKMAHSGRRLRKLFRYRSKGGRFLPELSNWWRDFEWEAGDVCVIHKGAWWGTPQIWARDEDEGKRVIRFAASEADIDPDEVGEWVVRSSNSPRIGMSGTMRIHMKDGFPWVANRDGSNFPNLLAQSVDP